MVLAHGSVATFLAGLALVLGTAYVLGRVSDRAGFVPVVGELLTGIVLGAGVLGVVAPSVTALVVPVPPGLAAVSFLGLVLLVVLAGTEIDVDLARASLFTTLVLATGSGLVPFLGGFALGWAIPGEFVVDPANRLPLALFLGTALSISAVPVIVRILSDLAVIEERTGQVTLGVAVIVDTVGWILLVVVADMAIGGAPTPVTVLRTLMLLALFTVLTLAVGRLVIRAVNENSGTAWPPRGATFPLVVIAGLALAAASSALGLEPVVGAFLAGVLARPYLTGEASRVLKAATFGIFAPAFFAVAGLQVDLSTLYEPTAALVASGILVVAIASKLIGVTVAGTFTTLSAAETRSVAIASNARGAMEIVVAALGVELGVLTPPIYGAILLVAIVTSIMTPPLLEWSLARQSPSDTPT